MVVNRKWKGLNVHLFKNNLCLCVFWAYGVFRYFVCHLGFCLKKFEFFFNTRRRIFKKQILDQYTLQASKKIFLHNSTLFPIFYYQKIDSFLTSYKNQSKQQIMSFFSHYACVSLLFMCAVTSRRTFFRWVKKSARKVIKR